MITEFQSIRRRHWQKVLLMALLTLLMPQSIWADDDLETTFIGDRTYYVLRSRSDWNKFYELVRKAAGKSDVNAIMDANITITEPVGLDAYPFRGVFDGNGHTLRVKIDWGNNYYAAPFPSVKEVTIRNLNVIGSVTGHRHTAGLIGHTADSSPITIERVSVNANITTKDKYVGGFIGHANSSDVFVTDCKFGGTLTANGASDSYGGAIVGWGENGGSWTMHRVYECGTYNSIGHAGFCYYNNGGTVVWGNNSKSTLCISYYNWGEMASDCKDISESEAETKMNSEKAGSWTYVYGKALPVMKTWPTADDVTFETYDMIPGTEKGEENMLKIPFSCDKPILWIEGKYTNEKGETKTISRMTFTKNTYSNFIMVPATEQHKDLTLTAKLQVGIVTKTIKNDDDAVMHNPLNLSAELLRFKKDSLVNAGTVLLKWKTKEPKYKDVVDGDQFIILRSLTGKMEDMESIGNAPLDDATTDYTYRDETLISSLEAKHMDLSTAIPQVRYIVVRSAAQQLWGLTDNVASANIGMSLNMLHLLRISDYAAKWESEADRTINVTWQYADEGGAVWDSRAEMKMLITSYNRDKAPVDTTTYVLTAEEMSACKKVVTLKRSCVNYKIEFLVDSVKSPLPLKIDLIKIRTAADWNALVDNDNIKFVSLEADITVSDQLKYFTGVFEGNGHKVTYNVNNGNWSYLAPFEQAANAVIRNLNVAGTISSSREYTAGLVAETKGDVLIENCVVSSQLRSTKSGNARWAGFVSIVSSNNNVTIRNCRFEGSFGDSDSNSNGGFLASVNGIATIENSLFAPSDISTKTDACDTWGRPMSNGKLNIINSYAAKEYNKYNNYFVIGDAADWDAFLKEAKSKSGRINAVLAADITVTTPMTENTFYGIFDGNGHTIHANISRNGDAALFLKGSDCTVRNLHVTGTILGTDYVGGIIARISVGTSVTITNCRVSAETKGGSNNGGFIGQGASRLNNLDNCLFDGRITGTGNTRGAAFVSSVGWNQTRMNNCLENGQAYIGLKYYGLCSDSNMGFTPPNSTNNWGFNMGDDANNMTVDKLVTQLGSGNWKVVNGEAIPVMNSVALASSVAGKNNEQRVELLGSNWMVDKYGLAVPKQEDNTQKEISAPSTTIPTFYYENLGHIDQNSLIVQTLQTSTLLTWANVDDEPVDYYEVWRRDMGTASNPSTGEWEPIVTLPTEMQYEDKGTSPVHKYEYKVRGVTSCEGLNYDETKAVEGRCVQTATVEGYLRFADGTGIPGKKVITTLADNTEVSSMTDESGFFRLSELPYIDEKETNYKLTTTVVGVDPKTITFGTEPGDNVLKDVVFEITQSVKLSGYVQYNGTSIPVQGVSFKVDGYEVHNAAGKVTTDAEGKFAFRVLSGSHDSIQAVMNGHTFYRDGIYHESDNDPDTITKYDFTADKAGIMFYDDTRVKLIGRVVGGKDQGAIPLGNSLSRNNLGDDLEMVLALEGDKSSRLVWDIKDRNKKERKEVFVHKAHDKKYEYKTTVVTTLNRMVITPDMHTGEYEVMLPPVKWKIQQITAKGYATLFQDGQMNDVIDLSDSLTLHKDTINGEWKTAMGVVINQVEEEYNAKYSRIYHSPVIIDYKQQGFDPFSYFGDRYYAFKNLSGTKEKLALAYGVKKANWPKGKRDSLETVYTFGYPVFSIDKKYGIKISATERYYYNNYAKSDTVDIIKLSGGEVTIHNGMVSSTHSEVVKLDSVGEANYVLEAAQTPYLLTGKNALRTVSMTLEMDGTHYEATPLRAYILNIQQQQGAKDIISYSTPQLIDVLRDPPGGASKATLSKGSTLKYSYTMDMKWSAGVSINVGIGSGVNSFTGVVVAPMGAGAVGGVNNGGSSTFGTSIDLVWSGSGQRAFNYTMTAKEDISTSTDKKLVGAAGDLYIGVDQNIVVKPATAIRAIPDSVFRQMGGLLKSGRTIEIAQGYDENDSLLHLVRDEVVTYGPVVNSTFVHSQDYIVKQLLPSLTEHILSLMFTGTEAEAKAQAEATGKPVYLSLVGKDDPDFGSKYKMILPKDAPANTENEVARYQQNMLKWVEMIAQNEKEKLEARDLVKNFDIDGGGSLSYSETFSSDYSVANSFVSPITAGTAGYFDNKTGDDLMGVVAIVGPVVAKILANILSGKLGKTTGETQLDGDDGGLKISVEAVGFTFKFSLSPSMSFSVTPKNTESKSYSRTESFSISMDKRSHLNFDVYRVKTKTDNLKSTDPLDVFYNNNFYDMVDYDYDHMKKEVDVNKFTYSRSFVYRTRAGATCRPWENERKTLFHETGTMLDERTKKIENPVIKMDKQSISGVPFGEPARFKLYLTNESEQPEAAYFYFDIYQVERTNPDGAKMMVDGIPLSGNGRTIEIHPGQVTEKTLEVYAGEKFDYKDLQIGLISQGDVDCYQTVAFDVHYLQTAGNIAISSPGDKWIMNCDAPYEEGKGWYLPVIISGFNKNQHNFDHIEFQYKEATRGDDYWTNLCGYYADSTIYRAATGTKEMIPENGNIVARFFGDGQVMEKGYDLRAVLFCRNGNSFLTNSSKVLTGVKDTRRPELFGTPEPKDGLLAAGDNIVFNFSEDIEYNYLQETTNFEVMGETNETSVQESPSLMFGGIGFALSQARRNFAEKSFTIEMMIKPNDIAEEMPIFSHGSDGKKLELWLTKDKKLKAIVDGRELLGNNTINTTGFQRVAMVLDNSKKQLMLYSEEQDGKFENVTYSGYGALVYGASNGFKKYYKGRMLEARVWNRALDLATLNRYGNKLLTGYELGLTDYYPMNDGKGIFAQDLAQGGHLTLIGTTWTLPQSMSLKFDKNEQRAGKYKGLQLIPKFFERDEEQNYTLMFWFKTDEQNGTLIANGSGRKTDEGAKNKFFIGFEDHILWYRSNKYEYNLGDELCNDVWHHYAMTVNRPRNVASIYIDNELKAQFTPDSLGGMLGTRFYLGNTVYQKEGDATVLEEHALTGYIDGIALFEQALPITLIKRYTNKAPGGTEKGLLTYVDFDHQERQKGGELVMEPYPLNKVVKYDDDGKPSEQHDSVFVDPVNDIENRIDRNIGAPMQAHESLRNLKFSFVGRNNQLLVNIDEQSSRINKRKIYVTVSDIPDKNGNFMSSPATECFFVNRNPLTWDTKRYTEVMQVGQQNYISLDIINNSGKAHTYTIENLPRWMTVDKVSNIVDALDRDHVLITISKDVNVGTYDDIIYLTDEDGMSEPLALDITIEGEEPEWTVDPQMKRYSMNVIGKVYVGNTMVTDSRDLVAAFDQNGRCMGVNNIEYNSETGESMLYMTIYDSTTVANRLFFSLWHYTTGKIMQLSTSKLVNFAEQTIAGTVSDPIMMFTDDKYMQSINLNEGWNWVSFNVYNAAFESVPSILNMFPWQEGDIMTEDSEDLTLIYRDGTWNCNSEKSIDQIYLSQEYCYRVKVKHDNKINFWGTSFKTDKDRTIVVKPNWNSIGYTPMVNLPVATALAEYYDHASDGDVIKNQHEFAMFVNDGAGGGKWHGTLKYMKPGEGYMLRRLKKDTIFFRYPYYEPGTIFIDGSSSSELKGKKSSRNATTMNLVARVEGIDMLEGDKLVAYAAGEKVGETCIAQSIDGEEDIFYLNIGGDVTVPLSFAIERGDDIIATTGDVMTYEANAISGSPTNPTKINFTQRDMNHTDGWYTVAGVKLNGKPSQNGVYIFNGKKQVIK